MTCVICQGSFNELNLISDGICSARFCRPCMKLLIDQNVKECPICKTEFICNSKLPDDFMMILAWIDWKTALTGWYYEGENCFVENFSKLREIKANEFIRALRIRDHVLEHGHMGNGSGDLNTSMAD